MFGLLGRLSVKALAMLGVGAGVAGVGAYQDIKKNGNKSFLSDIIQDANEIPGQAGAIAGANIGLTGLYATINVIGKFMMQLTGGKYGQGLIDFAQSGIEHNNDTKADPKKEADKAAALAANTPPTQTASLGGTLKTTVDSKNAFTLANLTEGLKNGTSADLVDKALLVGNGAGASVSNTLGFLTGQVLDIGDWTIGKLGEKTGLYSTDYAKRDLSRTFADGAVNGFEYIVGKPTLKTAWDRAAYGAGEFVPYLIPAGGAAGLTGLAAKAATTTQMVGGLVAANKPDLAPGTP